MPEQRHILITGSHRSGTTWVGRTISQHQSVKYVHEPFNIDRPLPHYGLTLDHWFEHFDSSSHQEQISLVFEILFGRLGGRVAFRTWKQNHKLLIPLLAGVIRKALAQRILVKDPIALLSAGWLYRNYDLQVICMIRSPLAFVGSTKAVGWDFDFNNFRNQRALMDGMLSRYAEQIESLCDQRSGDFIDRMSLLWNVLHFSIAKYREQYSDWLYLRHEDIASRPIDAFCEVFRHLGIGMNQRIRQYINQYTSDHSLQRDGSASYRPRDARSLPFNWKTRLSEKEAQRVTESTQSIASLFYPPGVGVDPASRE